MKNKKLIGFIVAASLAVGITTTFAQQAQPADPSSQSGQEQQDQPGEDPQAQPASPAIDEPAGAETGAFNKEKAIKEIAEHRMLEMDVAKLATQKAQDPQVKEYAQKLVDDHAKLSDPLKELAQKENITLPTEVDPKQQKMIDRLSGLSGAEFDKAFAALVVKDHKRDIAILKKAEQSDNPRVSEFAKKTLPVKEERLRTAQQWAPEASAGTAVEEPAGAEPKPDDANKLDQQNQDQPQQQQPQDPNQSQSPDSAGQVTP